MNTRILRSTRKKSTTTPDRCLGLEKLERRDLLAADVFISEFMADNDQTVFDVDRDASDWVELHNRGDQQQSLGGWHLTDSSSDLTKWQFPAVTISPGESLLVWASDKDRTDAGGELHTNFKLSKGGEFLALVRPNGSTIAAQFAPEFPAQFEDVSYGFAEGSTAGSTARYFLTPTPGAVNTVLPEDERPFISDVDASSAADFENIVVTAEVIPTSTALTGVELHYRVMYGAEVTVPMFDDGQHGDGAANDDVFGAAIPAAASDPGEMVRYYVIADEGPGPSARLPLFPDPVESSEYLGVVIPDATVSSSLPIFQIFTEDPNWFRNSNGTINKNEVPGSFFYDGTFYDNIQIRVRGQTSVDAAYPNQKFKISFNDDNRFEFGDGREDVGSINLDNVYQDPSYARLTLGAEVFREAGAYAQLVEPVHMRMNGEFYSLGIFSERYKGPFLRRNELPDEGALYESEGIFLGPNNLSPNAGNLANTAGFEKDNREYETSFADLQAFVDGISPSNPNREQYIYDNVNIPVVLDVLAGYSITKHYDRDTHNFYVYRDSDGTGEWSLLPYDLDLIWDRLSEPVFATFFSGHPFEGSSQDPTWAGTHWNRLHDAFADIPSLREMVVRRLRTVMDELLQPLSTAYEDRYLENRVDELFAEVQPEAALDLAKWGTVSGGAWGGPQLLGAGVEQLKDAFDSRRAYLYGLDIVPDAQSPSAAIRIGEVDAAPISGDQDQEFIELVNPNSYAVDISGWRLTSAVNYEFVKGVVIPANSSLYVTPDVVAFRARTSGPAAGQSKLVQGGYAGNLSSAGETIRLERADGSTADSLAYDPVTAAPLLASIAPQTLFAGQTSSAIPLQVTDADTPIANLTFTGTAQSQAYLLDQQLNLNDPAAPAPFLPYGENYRGSSEKYLLNPAGVHPTNRWYYLLPNGDFYRFTGTLSAGSSSAPSPLQGQFIASLGTDVYANPALLHNAPSQSAPISFQFTTGSSPSFVMTADAGFVGSFTATVTVSDGTKTDSESFNVQVSQPTTAASMLAAWEANYGNQNASVAGGPSAGDWNNDLAVNGSDFLIWQRSIHQLITSATQASTAPTAVLMVGTDAALAAEIVDIPLLAQATAAFSVDFTRKDSRPQANDTDIAFASAIVSIEKGNSSIDFTSLPRDRYFEDGASSLADSRDQSPDDTVDWITDEVFDMLGRNLLE